MLPIYPSGGTEAGRPAPREIWLQNHRRTGPHNGSGEGGLVGDELQREEGGVVVVEEVAERTTVGEGAVEVADGNAVDGADCLAPAKEEREGGFKEDVRLNGGAAGVAVTLGDGVWPLQLQEVSLLAEFSLIQLQLHLQHSKAA